MKLITLPEQIHWSETREFVVLMEENQQIRLRIVESSTGIAVFKYEDGVWSRTNDEKIIMWIENEMIDEEIRLNYELREKKQIEKEHEETVISDHTVVDTDNTIADK